MVVSGAAVVVVLGAVWRMAESARRALKRLVEEAVMEKLTEPDRAERRAPAAVGLRVTGPFGGAGVSPHGGRGGR
ncbi:hypothetical protein [Streptomyces sp. NPDC001985]|uniref:hypothetical protein n=1 Tax=Streptomyces sp. NPDC001985 TaxID=3154406 RepID=UPI003318C048